jgi:hypothetical protein
MDKRKRAGIEGRGAWPFDDEVLALREFGTDRVYPLSPTRRLDLVGSESQGEVALVHRRSCWSVKAADGAPSGIVQHDDAPVREVVLVPGLELVIDGVTLIAESERVRALVHYLSRVIGFNPKNRPTIDHALRAVLVAARGRRPLVLHGNGDLSYIGRKLHHHTLPEQPFVLCDRRKTERSDEGRVPPNVHDPLDALAKAAGGTLCIPEDRLPDDFDLMMSRWQESSVRVQLILGAPSIPYLLPIVADPVTVVPLSQRWYDRFQIMNEVAAESATAFGIPPCDLSKADREMIVEEHADTLPELEIATERMVAIRHWADGWGGLVSASRALGMTHASLAEWAERRGLITVRHRGPNAKRRRPRATGRRTAAH